MNARTKLNLGLLALLLCLALFVWLTPPHQDAEDTTELLNLKSDDITRIEIERTGNDMIRLHRDQDRWWLRLPFTPDTVAASEFRIQSLLALTTMQSRNRFAVQTPDLAKYGLEKPRVIVRINGIELHFGDAEALHQRRYVRFGDWIHLVDGQYYTPLLIEGAQYADTALLPGHPALASIKIPGLTLHRQDNGSWTGLPTDQTLGADTLNAYIDFWRYAQAVELEFRLDSPKRDDWVIVTRDGESIRFTVINEASRTIVVNHTSRLGYRLEQGTLDKLRQPARHHTRPIAEP